jgi:hypothetical protein
MTCHCNASGWHPGREQFLYLSSDFFGVFSGNYWATRFADDDKKFLSASLSKIRK